MSDTTYHDVVKHRRSEDDDIALWDRFRGKPGEDVKVSAVHRLKIAGSAPDGFGLHMRQIVPPDELRGEMLMRGIWRIGMDRLVLPDGEAPWGRTTPT
ncbi:MAG: hypothetical protein L3J02_06710, partial [Henriciella sp.]|nr:hypothetical protein [Henriciella sp.]